VIKERKKRNDEKKLEKVNVDDITMAIVILKTELRVYPSFLGNTGRSIS
jgi:hypothetical protein